MNELDSRALVSLEEARSYCWRDENDGTRDAVLIDAVNLVSAAIWDHCERELRPSGTGITRTFQLTRVVCDGAVYGWIDLAPYDLYSLTQVAIHTDSGSPRVLTADEYRLEPAGRALGGTYLSIRTIAPEQPEAQPGFGWQAEVTGSWGMSSVPRAVKMAALEWAKNLTANPGSFAAASQAGYAVAPDTDLVFFGGGMPASVRYRLQPYRRRP